jgi:hypothetical protein
LFSHVPNIWSIDPGWFRLVAKKKDYPPNCFSKGAVKEEVLNILIPVATNTLLTSFPIFPSQVVFG